MTIPDACLPMTAGVLEPVATGVPSPEVTGVPSDYTKPPVGVAGCSVGGVYPPVKEIDSSITLPDNPMFLLWGMPGIVPIMMGICLDSPS